MPGVGGTPEMRDRVPRCLAAEAKGLRFWRSRVSVLAQCFPSLPICQILDGVHLRWCVDALKEEEADARGGVAGLTTALVIPRASSTTPPVETQPLVPDERMVCQNANMAR